MGTMKHAAALAAVSIAGAGIFAALPASAASAAPVHAVHQASTVHQDGAKRSVNVNCGSGATSGNQWTCLEIGQNPWYIRISNKVLHSHRTGFVCLVKNGHRYRCSPVVSLKAGHSVSRTYSYLGPGRYCAVLWRQNRNGSRNMINKGQCIPMH